MDLSSILLVPASAEYPSFHRPRRLTRRAHIDPPYIFTPQDPTLTPELHFPLQTMHPRAPFPRFINRFDSRQILLVVDGSCLGNGRPDLSPRGGCSFLYKKGPHTPAFVLGAGDENTPNNTDGGQGDGRRLVDGKIAFRLEERGPGGDVHDQTSNRAKLRAVIAALQFRAWGGEGWRSVVVLTDLEYVVQGATAWLPQWVRRRWKRVRGGKVANRDLWEELQAAVEESRRRGAEVAFWLVAPGDVARQSELLQEAKEAAREAARTDPVTGTNEFTRICGILT